MKCTIVHNDILKNSFFLIFKSSNIFLANTDHLSIDTYNDQFHK